MARLQEFSSSLNAVPAPILISLTAIGALFMASKAFSFIRLLFSLFILPGKPLRSFGPRSSWAVVTGASDGIGLEFASQLAAAGFNVAMISRTESKLAAAGQGLRSAHPHIEIKWLAMDFASASEADFGKLAHFLGGLQDIAVLVNNVGLSHEMPVDFSDTATADAMAIVDVNCRATLRVTAIVLPHLLARRRGLVLTMGSFAGLLSTPQLAVYAGSKAFLQAWSTALGAEVEPQGVTVRLVQSHLIASSMSKIRRPTAVAPSPRSFVHTTLSSIGRSGGAQDFAYTSNPWWTHALIEWAIGTFLGYSNKLVLNYVKRMHNDIRRRALRKRVKEEGRKAA